MTDVLPVLPDRFSLADEVRVTGRPQRRQPTAAAALVAHLPGKHDQSSHGKGGGSGGGGVRGSLASAKTTSEVNTAAAAEAKAITGRDIAFELGGDPQIAREHAEGVLQGLERYPNTPLRRVQQGANPYAENVEAWAATSPDGDTIYFTNDAQRYGAAAYRADLRNARGDIVVNTPVGVALHEFGHSVANSYGLNGWANNRANQYAEIEMGTTDLSSAVRKSISRRAAENNHELAAEAFADVAARGSKASGMSKLIVEKFDEEIEDVDAAVLEEDVVEL